MTQISPNLLRDLASDEGLSEADLQVLHLALTGKTPTEIKELLGAQSENAVQKKLARIYAKFRIPGAGPGKLAKLQTILMDRIQARQGKKKVLVAWASQQGRLQAEAIQDLLKHPQIKALTLNLEAKEESKKLESELEWVELGVICLPEAALTPSVNFVVGFLMGRLKTLWLAQLCHKRQLESGLPLPAVNLNNSQDLTRLLHHVLGGELQDVKDWVAFKTSSATWTEKVAQLMEQPVSTPETLEPEDSIIQVGQKLLRENSHFVNNSVFHQITTRFLADTHQYIDGIRTKNSIFSIPLELYPRYLVALQVELNVRVMAVTIIDSVEQFWPDEVGDEISETARKDSERLFVFTSEKDFNKSLTFLLRHAARYKVYVTTKDIYLPYAEEFSLRDRPKNWQEDFSLPTKKFAIIENPENGDQIIGWYDEENIKDKRNKRLVHFSPINGETDQYKKVLSNFLERANTRQGVFQLTEDSGWSDRKLPEKLNSVREELFTKRPKSPARSPKELLLDLQHLRNELMQLDTKDEVIQRALEVVQTKLSAQVVSIFLFNKDGRLQRVGLKGIDLQGRPVNHPDFFPSESYAVGESFTGKAAVSGPDGFGEPRWTNKLHEEFISESSKREYLFTFDSIQSAIAVPLNGRHKTYGVIEVLNKIDSITKRVIPSRGFLQDEVYWLAAISSAVASAISNIRISEQNKLFADLSSYLVSNSSDPSSVYSEVAKHLISKETAFKACIVRVRTPSGSLKVAARDGENVAWEQRIQNKDGRKPGEGFVGRVIQSSEPKPVVVSRIADQLDKFINQDWIHANQFKSFGCFPMIYKGEVVGAISLFTTYEYDFHRECRDFLEGITSLVAAFIGRVEKEKKISDVKALVESYSTFSSESQPELDEELPQQQEAQQQSLHHVFLEQLQVSLNSPRLSQVVEVTSHEHLD